MTRSDRARGVGQSLFDRNWSRASGGWQGLAKGAQMVRGRYCAVWGLGSG